MAVLHKAVEIPVGICRHSGSSASSTMKMLQSVVWLKVTNISEKPAISIFR